MQSQFLLNQRTTDSIKMSNRSIAKNTLMLYIRMIISTLISIYTSRVVLESLGIDDYGIYNIVGGTVAIVGFLSSTMSTATSRFFSIALGNNNKEYLKKLFNTATSLHIILAIIILIVAETLGLWFVNNVLNFPENQMYATNVVYQLSIAATCIAIIQIPYDALIVSHEDFSIFAYFQILNSALKLGAAIALLYIVDNKLVIYSVLIFCISLIMRACYGLYSIKHYEECRFKFHLDKTLVKSLTSFSGWDLLGHLGFTARQQGSNIILNIFFGTAINAASGIATTIQGVVTSFSYNIITAARPQIIKTYSQKDFHQFHNLLSNISTLSLFMMMLVSVPVIINIQNVLSIWLTTVPTYSAQFAICCLIGGIVSSISSVLLIGIHATGLVKPSSLTRNITYIASVFAIYIMFSLGFSPIWAYVIIVITQVIAMIVDSIILREAYPIHLQLKLLIKIFSIILISAISAAISLKTPVPSNSWLVIILRTILYETFFISLSFACILNATQKKIILTKLHIKK